jgi:hypothetical protein
MFLKLRAYYKDEKPVWPVPLLVFSLYVGAPIATSNKQFNEFLLTNDQV